MKICSQCNIEKDETYFYKNKKYGLFPYCKLCAKKKYAEKHYQDNKQLYKERTLKRHKQLRDDWIEFKKQFSCSICGESRYWCIDFHHVDSKTKEDVLPRIFKNNSREMFEAELKKCIPVCRNCHADIHYKHKLMSR